MKIRNNHTFYNGLCCGCNSAVSQEEIDPDKLYLQLLCGRCRTELEELPLRHKKTFDKLKIEIERIEGVNQFLATKIKILEGFIISKGLNPMEAK